MILKQITIILLFFGVFISGTLYAQELADTETDDLGNVSDAFQENFFEALKQKGIENFELAIEALVKAERAAKKQPQQEAIVYFEMGKNYAKLKKYDEAERYLLKVSETKKERLDVMEALYDLYYRQRDYDKSIPLVKKLIVADPDYKEDLANIYFRTKKYDAALMLLDEIDEAQGENLYRNTLRNRIYQVTGNKEAQIEKLNDKLDGKNKKERDYVNLIYLYSQEGNKAKAFETAKELIKEYPKSELAHLSLYKFYLDAGQTEAAIASMNSVFAATSSAIKKDDKYKVLSDYIGFVSANPNYESSLEEVLSNFSEEGTGNFYEKVGQYFLAKGDKVKALGFFEKGIEKDEDNFSLLKNTLLLQIEQEKYTEVVALSAKGLEVFPAQPILYLLNGVANNQLKNTEKALVVLEEGVDYIFDNPTMEKDFYTQLEIACTQKGDTKNAKKYAKKASAIVLN